MATTITITRPTAVMRRYAGADRAQDQVYMQIDPASPLGLRRETRVDSQRFANSGYGAWTGTVGELLLEHGIERSDDAIRQLSYDDIATLTRDPNVVVVL